MERDHIILDRLERAAEYTDMHPAFERAFAYLRQDNLADLPAGRYTVDSPGIGTWP